MKKKLLQKFILLSLLLIGLVFLLADSRAAAPAGQWWNLSWTKRKQLTVSAASGNTVSSGYSVKFTASGSAAADIYNDSLANGNDFRIVYWNGSAWVGLDRDLVTFTSTSIEVWFKLQAAIAGGASDNNYYAYYGNSGVGTPPANKDNIYMFYDDFSSGNLDKWDSVNTGVSVVSDAGNNVVELETGAGSWIVKKYNDSGWTNYRVSFRVKLVTPGTFGYRWSAVGRGGTTGGYEWGVTSNSNTLYFRNWVTATRCCGGSYTWGAGWYDSAFDLVGSTLKGYIVDLVTPWTSCTNTSFTYGGIRFGTWDTSSKIYVDNVLVRALVATEPTVGAGSEESAPTPTPTPTPTSTPTPTPTSTPTPTPTPAPVTKTMVVDSGSGGGVVSAATILNPVAAAARSQRLWVATPYSGIDFHDYEKLQDLYNYDGATPISNLSEITSSGTYKIEDDYTIASSPCGLPDAVVFINGDVTTISTNFASALNNPSVVQLLVARNACNSSLAFVVKGDLTIAPTVNNIYGIFYAGGDIITEASATPPDGRLYVFGSLLANGFDLRRTLQTDNANYPAEQVIFMPKYFLDLGSQELLGQQKVTWREVR